jgi:hypothetical protein
MLSTKTPYRTFNNENGSIAIFSFLNYDVVSWKLRHEDTYHIVKSRQYRTVNALFNLIKERLTQ